MKNMECVITIEIGTNAVRVMAFDLSGKVIASMKGHINFSVEPDYSEQDPIRCLLPCCMCLRICLTKKFIQSITK